MESGDGGARRIGTPRADRDDGERGHHPSLDPAEAALLGGGVGDHPARCVQVEEVAADPAELQQQVEGRGIGLMHKLQAYSLQDAGSDTVDANLELGLPADARDYGTGAQILVDLGIRTMVLLTNNPTKRAGLEGYGLEIVGRQSLPTLATPENLRYLKTKRDRMGHDLPGLAAFEDEATEATVQPFADGIPDVRWTVFEDSSHMPHVEEEERFLQVLGDFLDEHDEHRPAPGTAPDPDDRK